VYAVTDIDTSKKFNPNLTILDPAPAGLAPADTISDSAGAGGTDFVRMITADSARVVSPKPRTVITANTVAYEIEPMLPVDSVKLFVHHSQNRRDTLGVISSPPYKAIWDCASAPDQDPAHLQFGYILYAPGLVIVSPPKPHLWALRRGSQAPSHTRHYSIRQQGRASDFPLDGSRDKWSRAQSGRFEGESGIGEFRMLWSSAKLYFTAWINDTSITPGDFVELHLDMYRDRTDFPGITHRSLRFGPFTRSITFTGEYIEGKGYVRCDSLGQLFRDEMDWRAVTELDRGYTIEAAIPFSLLSGFELPPSQIGMDITVMNVDRVTRGGNAGDLFDDLFGDDEDDVSAALDTDADNANDDTGKLQTSHSTLQTPIKRTVNPIGATIGRIEHDTSYYSWAGGGRFTRYSPNTWGTARFSHAAIWFKMLFYALVAIILIFAVLTIMQTVLARRNEIKEDRMMEDNYSPVTEAVIECIENRLTETGFGIKDVLKSIDKNENEVAAALQKDLDITFDRLLTIRRIKRSQGLMKDPDLTIDKIAAMCGFADVNAYRAQYTALMNVDPEISRQAVQDRIREDREAEEDDDD